MKEIRKIKQEFLCENSSVNSIAKNHGIAWDTANTVITLPMEELKDRGKRPNRKSQLVTDEVVAEIDNLLMDEIQKKVRKKQRLTAKVIYRILKEEKKIFKGSIRTLERAVKERRRHLGKSKNKSSLPLHYPLGSTLRIDHGEVDLVIENERVKAYHFVASVPGYVIRFCQVFPIKSREAWGEFIERTFQFFGGIFPDITVDNDSVLVKKILGTEREQTDFALELQQHYGFIIRYCNPAAGNEKGDVENAVGFCRRNFLHGLPEADSWSLINRDLESLSHQIIKESTHYKTREPIKEYFDKLPTLLDPLMPEKKWRKRVVSKVDACQLVTVDKHDYSVPERYVGSHTDIRLMAFHVEIYVDDERAAIHPRQFGKDDSLILDHYLDQLLYKCGAFRDCKAVQQHKFHPLYEELWNRLSSRCEGKEKTSEFVHVLILRRFYSQETLLLAIQQALDCGAIKYRAIEAFTYQIERQKRCSEQEYSIDDQEAWVCSVDQYAALCGGGR